jgi:hypothetical protein
MKIWQKYVDAIASSLEEFQKLTFNFISDKQVFIDMAWVAWVPMLLIKISSRKRRQKEIRK